MRQKQLVPAVAVLVVKTNQKKVSSRQLFQSVTDKLKDAVC